jgi:hypothetical protein
MELQPFGNLNLELASDRLFMLGATSAGNRIIQEIAGARFEGERMKASLKGQAAADWLSVDANGLATFDIRMLLETDDGALVYFAYVGTADWSQGLGSAPVYVVANLESSDERYRWVNTAHIVGKGVVGGGGVAYEFAQIV